MNVGEHVVCYLLRLLIYISAHENAIICLVGKIFNYCTYGSKVCSYRLNYPEKVQKVQGNKTTTLITLRIVRLFWYLQNNI